MLVLLHKYAYEFIQTFKVYGQRKIIQFVFLFDWLLQFFLFKIIEGLQNPAFFLVMILSEFGFKAL